MRWSIALLIFGCACGARTEIGVGTASTRCTRSPWVLFDSWIGPCAIRLDGTDFHRLDLPIGARSPWVSPDGSTMLYFSTDGSTDWVVLRDLPSGTERTLASLAFNDFDHPFFGHATISPDAKWISYAYADDLHLLAFDGSDDHVLVHGVWAGPSTPTIAFNAEFSADSSQIYYATIGALSSIRIDGSDPQILFRDESNYSDAPGAHWASPDASLSPDGKQLVANVMCDTKQIRTYALGSLPTSAPCTTGTKLADIKAAIPPYGEFFAHPAWGAAGTIAYVDDIGSDGTTMRIFVVSDHGGATTDLSGTHVDGGADHPAWASGCAALP